MGLNISVGGIGLAPSSLLHSLPATSVDRLREGARPVQLRAGEWLFHEGDAADCAYLVQSGRIEVVGDGMVIRTVRRGGVIGELGLLSDNPRSASVRASRDCELWQISRSDFERLIVEDQEFALTLCRRLGAQLAEHRSPAVTAEPPRAIAIVPLDERVDVGDIADRLGATLRERAEAAVLHAQPAGDTAEHFATFDRALSANRWLILVATHRATDPWTQAILGEADRVLAVSRGTVAPGWLANAAALRGCELLQIGAAVPPSALQAIGPSAVQTLSGEAAFPRCLGVIARRLQGRAVGIVFSGGGARAFAHLGVFEELRATGVQIDRVAGVSMGAIVAGTVAMDMDAALAFETFVDYFAKQNPSGDYTLPLYSMVRGGRARRMLADRFGTTRIEELPLRFFCMSADLNGRTPVIHRIGLLCDAVLASASIPGVFPPIPTPDGQLLVDGGVLDNLPVETMAREREGPVIAVDVSRPAAWRPGGDESLARWRARARWLVSGQQTEMPRLAETMLRTIAVGSRDTVEAARRHADIVIRPAVERTGLMDWKQLPSMREAGRAAVRQLVEEDPQALDGCL